RAADVLQLAGADALRPERVTVVVLVDRETLAADLAVVALLAVGERVRALEAVLTEEEEEIELALHVELALHLVDTEQMLPARGLEQVRRVDGAGGDSAPRVQFDEAVVLDDLGEFALIEHSVNGHLSPSP